MAMTYQLASNLLDYLAAGGGDYSLIAASDEEFKKAVRNEFGLPRFGADLPKKR
jgi:thiamine monophosphate kinase